MCPISVEKVRRDIDRASQITHIYTCPRDSLLPYFCKRFEPKLHKCDYTLYRSSLCASRNRLVMLEVREPDTHGSIKKDDVGVCVPGVKV